MGQARWDDVRREAYAKNNYCCWACGVHKRRAWRNLWLEAHETYTYDVDARRATLGEIVALCQRCHMFIHANMLVGNIDWSRSEVEYILTSGFFLLDSAGLAANASPENKYILWMYDRSVYTTLFGSDSPTSRYDMPQERWVLVWKGYEWVRSVGRIRCRRVGATTPYVRCMRDEEGTLVPRGE